MKHQYNIAVMADERERERREQWQEVIDILKLIFQVLYHVIVEGIKAVLPWGYLPEKSVVGRRVLITGAASGIGREMAYEFASRGASLILLDVNEGENERTAREVRSRFASVEVSTYTVDLSNRELTTAVAERVKREKGSPYILVNNAGIVYAKLLTELTDAQIEKTFAINVLAHFWLTRAFLPDMLAQNDGHIVSIASVLGMIGVGKCTDYCASKFAAVGFADSLVSELRGLGKTGIKVTTVGPNLILTGMFAGVDQPAAKLFPPLQPDYVAKCVVESVLTDRELLLLPKANYWGMLAKSILPPRAANALLVWLRYDTALATHIGRRTQ